MAIWSSGRGHWFVFGELAGDADWIPSLSSRLCVVAGVCGLDGDGGGDGLFSSVATYVLGLQKLSIYLYTTA